MKVTGRLLVSNMQTTLNNKGGIMPENKKDKKEIANLRPEEIGELAIVALVTDFKEELSKKVGNFCQRSGIPRPEAEALLLNILGRVHQEMKERVPMRKEN